jgi:hypothetical protein
VSLCKARKRVRDGNTEGSLGSNDWPRYSHPLVHRVSWRTIYSISAFARNYPLVNRLENCGGPKSVRTFATSVGEKRNG